MNNEIRLSYLQVCHVAKHVVTLICWMRHVSSEPSTILFPIDFVKWMNDVVQLHLLQYVVPYTAQGWHLLLTT